MLNSLTSPRPLSVVYLLDDTVLFGGVKVILNQANLLSQRGHRVTVLSRGPSPSWMEIEADFRQVQDFGRSNTPAADVTVATYWTTIAPAMGIAYGEVAHYCQGFEATYTHNTEDHPSIVEAYRNPLPAFVVSPHLGHLLKAEFGRPSRLVVQPLEPFWRVLSARKRRPARPARVLVVGPWEGDWKGVSTALDAFRQMRLSDTEIRLIRLSQYPLTNEEQSYLEADEYHCHLEPARAARLVEGCDLLLAPSWEQEGFGLPVLEALASGVPVVASDISCFRDFASEAAILVPAHEPTAFAAAATDILRDPASWRQHRKAGLAVARRFTPRKAMESAERALRWVASGEWRGD
jgi:glycosyltransferase involved in cell wall biosynthesis